MRLSRRIPGHYPQTLRGVIHTTGSTSLIATPPEDRATTRGHAQNFGEIGRVVRRYARGQTRHTDTITKILRSLIAGAQYRFANGLIVSMSMIGLVHDFLGV